MRRYKTPEQLKSWRERQDRLNARLKAEREGHEAAMQKWADENCLGGNSIICPDGIVRHVRMTRFDLRRSQEPQWIRERMLAKVWP
jgi:hypothetical protein